MLLRRTDFALECFFFGTGGTTHLTVVICNCECNLLRPLYNKLETQLWHTAGQASIRGSTEENRPNVPNHYGILECNDEAVKQIPPLALLHLEMQIGLADANRTGRAHSHSNQQANLSLIRYNFARNPLGFG